jgi:hypothetical protein
MFFAKFTQQIIAQHLVVIRHLRNKISILLLIVIVLQLIVGCRTKWTQAIQSGEVAQYQFRETIDIEIKKGLIFVPVTIEEKEYLFLFDSGAPFSISNKLQNDHNFKVVSKGNIVDSDHNRKKVNWSQVDTISIGNVLFTNQTAFIGDFEANPLLRCLEFDGIIGSNLIRHCNWTIDQQQNSLTLYNGIRDPNLKSHIIIPFKTDYQYNIFTDINVGQAIVRNILVDYGSNGSIALTNDIFTTLKDRDIISETLLEKGVQQSGIVGKTINLNREIAYSDSISIDSTPFKKVMLRTGKTVSIGNSFLSRFRVTIDWDNRNMHLFETSEIPDIVRFPGFKLGYSATLGVYVQSVVEHSNAYHKGVRPNMKVVKLDELDFESNYDFCDYVNHELGETIYLELIDSSGYKKEYDFEQTIK